MRLRLAPALCALAILFGGSMGASAQKPAVAAPAQAPPKPSAAADVATASARIIPAPATHKFPNGQTFFYDVEWRLWRAGTATIRLDAGGVEQRVTGAEE